MLEVPFSGNSVESSEGVTMLVVVVVVKIKMVTSIPVPDKVILESVPESDDVVLGESDIERVLRTVAVTVLVL